MKKKHAFLVILGISIFGLTACERFQEMFYFGGNSHGPRSDVSTPPPGDTVPYSGIYRYQQYVNNNVYRLSATPSTGNPKLLIIPVWFNDSSNYIDASKKDNVREDIQTAYFGSNEETGWRSVSSYYYEESHEAVNLTGTVSEWYSVNSSISNYANDTGSSKTSTLVENAVTWYFNNHTEDIRTSYDNDGDGYLDGVMLIYAAPDYDALGQSQNNLWAYCFWIQNTSYKNVGNPGPNAFFWASYDFMYSDAKALIRTGKSYASGDTSHCLIDAHTYIHEMGHMFGLEDYYDYSKYSYSPAAGFSMQDHNVGGHDPFSCFALGWAKAYVPIETTIIDLKTFTSSGEVILLSPQPTSYDFSPFGEYLLLEYYTPDGLNEFDILHPYLRESGKKSPTGSKERGIRVWHVDARLAYVQAGKYSTDRITTNPTISSRVHTAMSNTYYHPEVSDSYLSVFHEEGKNDIVCNYNLLQLIKKSGTGYKSKDSLTTNMLFRDGSEFKMSTSNIASQFVNSGKLNSGLNLGFSFKVNALNSTYASIEITKL